MNKGPRIFIFVLGPTNYVDEPGERLGGPYSPGSFSADSHRGYMDKNERKPWSYNLT